MRAPIYLDYNATAPVDPDVADAIAPYLHEFFGTPASSHIHGQLAREAVTDARHSVFPPGVPVLAVEAGVALGWHRYADDVVSIERFGVSAPGNAVLERLGMTPEHVAQRARALLAD